MSKLLFLSTIMDEKAMNQLYMSLGKDKTENAQILETIIECKHQNIQLMNIGLALFLSGF